jgi:hypothetical protein
MKVMNTSTAPIGTADQIEQFRIACRAVAVTLSMVATATSIVLLDATPRQVQALRAARKDADKAMIVYAAYARMFGANEMAARVETVAVQIDVGVFSAVEILAIAEGYRARL